MRTFFEAFEAPEFIALLVFGLVFTGAEYWLRAPF
jgi:hypothetical protein